MGQEHGRAVQRTERKAPNRHEYKPRTLICPEACWQAFLADSCFRRVGPRGFAGAIIQTGLIYNYMNDISPLKYGAIGAIITALIGAGIATAVFTSATITTLTATTAAITTLTATTQQVGASGSVIDFVGFATSSVNIASIAANGSTSSLVTVTGAAVGDDVKVSVISGDLYSSTSTSFLFGRVISANTVSTTYRNTSSTAAFDAGDSVIGVTVISK